MAGTTGSSAGTQRVVALVVLLAAGILSLPLVAAFLDGASTEDLVVPLQLVLMALVGAVTGRLLPGLAGPGSSRARGAGTGVVAGVAMGLVGVAVFLLLLG